MIEADALTKRYGDKLAVPCLYAAVALAAGAVASKRRDA
jgi:hypothetical protein